MKITSTGTAPSGHPIINLRVGANELDILRGMLTVAITHTPETSETAKTVQRMRAMLRCLNSAPVAQWIEHGDSTSSVAGSNPAGGTKLDRSERCRKTGFLIDPKAFQHFATMACPGCVDCTDAPQ